MTPQIWAFLGIIATSIFTAWTARNGNKRDRAVAELQAKIAQSAQESTSDIERQRVDGEALERARVITDGVTGMLTAQLDRVSEDLDKTRAQLEETRVLLEAERAHSRACQEQVSISTRARADLLRRESQMVTAFRDIVVVLRQENVPAVLWEHLASAYTTLEAIEPEAGLGDG